MSYADATTRNSEFCIYEHKNEATILPDYLLKPPLHLSFVKCYLYCIFQQQRQANLSLDHVLFYIHGS